MIWEDPMKLPNRRQFLRLATGACAIPIMSRLAWAQGYPARPVRIIVPYAPATSPDIIGRLLAQWVSERLRQSIIIENRPGAGGTIGTEAAVRASPDGYTLLYTVTANAISATLVKNLNFDFLRDIVPIAGIVRLPNLVSVTPSIPVETLPQLIAYAKANPGKLNFGAPTAGTTLLAAELFKFMTGVDIVHVAYRGGAAAITDLMSGQIQVSFDAMATTIEYARTGKLRALAVTTATRSSALPDVPAVAEFVPGYEASSWHGLGAPKNTPSEVVGKLNKEINAGLADPALIARIVELGGAPMPMTAREFGQFCAAETAKWAEVIKFAGIETQ
jgi:tripartite-type tricarboxylate transporter receptor subunit TctC